MECGPIVGEIYVADETPALSVAEATGVPPSRNVTIPLGLPNEVDVTSAVSISGKPAREFCAKACSTVLVGASVMLTMDELLSEAGFTPSPW